MITKLSDFPSTFITETGQLYEETKNFNTHNDFNTDFKKEYQENANFYENHQISQNKKKSGFERSQQELKGLEFFRPMIHELFENYLNECVFY